MRQFASTGFRIWNLSLEAKLVYTGFGVMSLLALFVSALFYEDMVGHTNEGVRAYYAGDAPSPAAPLPATLARGGPRIELPDEAASAPAPQLTVAVTYRKLLEATHFHLFSVPVFLLVIAHLFMLTGLPQRAKVAWIAGAWISAFLHLGAPWLVHYGGAAWTWTYPSSGALLALTTTVLTVYPMWSMWRGRPPAAARPVPIPDEHLAD